MPASELACFAVLLFALLERIRELLLGQLCVKCGYAVKLLPAAALMTQLMIGCHLVAQGLKKASE